MKRCKECKIPIKENKWNANKFCSYSCYHNNRWPADKRKYVKVDDIWFKGRCSKCGQLITSGVAKLCRKCRWPKNNPVRIAGKVVPHYHPVHNWIKATLGQPRLCEDCGFVSPNSRQFHWANISGEYRKIVNDWKRLCVSCHIKFDRKEGR